jgi:hypothetical protein
MGKWSIRISTTKFLVPCVMFLTGCSISEDLPDVFKGQVHGARLAIPRHYTLMSVTYDKEDDWTPPTKPKSQRTFTDHINTIEFLIDLDHPNTLVDVDSVRGRWPLDSIGPSGVVFGHILTAAAMSGGVADDPLGIERYRLNRRKFDPTAPAKDGGQMYGLRAMHADRSSPEFQRTLELNGVARLDLELYDRNLQTLIYCDYSFTAPGVSPRRETSTCEMSLVEPDLHLFIQSNFDRRDLAQWPAIRSSLLTVVGHFRKLGNVRAVKA